MEFNIQPVLTSERITLSPLRSIDFDALYATASDPKIWEQHPERDRWKEEVFRSFFEGAMESKGAFRIIENATKNTIGSTRFYHFNERENSIYIGYTFYAVSCWGTGINPLVKGMMLDYIFGFVSKVYFQVGAHNLRSQIAVERLGATRTEIPQTGVEALPPTSVLYEMKKSTWLTENACKARPRS